MSSVPPRALALALLLTPAAAWAGKQKIQHKSVGPLPAEAKSATVADIGTLTDVEPAADGWVVAGTTGVAMLGADLAPKWSVPLASAGFRQVAVDGSGVVWTAYSDAGTAKVEGLKGLMAMALKERHVYGGATVGTIGLDGAAGFTTELGEDVSVSGPALSGDRIYLTTSDAVLTVNRADGTSKTADIAEQMAKDSKLASGLMMGGGMMGKLLGLDKETLQKAYEIQQHASRPLPPVVHQGSVWAQVGWITCQLDTNGDITWVSPPLKGRASQGTANPVAFGDYVAFGGTSGMAGMKDRVVALEVREGKDPGVAFGTAVLNQVKGMETSSGTNWTLFGLTDLDPLDDERLLVVGEVTARMLNAKGKVEWEAWNKKGGLYRSNSRALDLFGSAARRWSHGHLAVAQGDTVFVASVYEDSDVLTLLEAENGKYRQSWTVGGRLADLAEGTGSLAVLTQDRLVVVPR